MLLYDFDRLQLSLKKFKTLVNEYPVSKYTPQSLYVLSYYEPELDWKNQLETYYPGSSFLEKNSTREDTSRSAIIANKRDYN